jgi:hypothetical protein
MVVLGFLAGVVLCGCSPLSAADVSTINGPNNSTTAAIEFPGYIWGERSGFWVNGTCYHRLYPTAPHSSTAFNSRSGRSITTSSFPE